MSPFENFRLLGDDVADLSTELEVQKNKIEIYDEKVLKEARAKQLKIVDDKN